MPFGAPNNDRVGVDRPGDNLFGTSLVAVDANTGKYLWHFQVVHHDIWDDDTQDPPILVDVKHDGKVIPAVITVNKNSLMFILNRVTGKPIYGVEERPVPKSNVPGEQTSPTQPFPVKPEPLAQNRLTRDNLYKDTPEHKAWCEKYVDDNHMRLGEVPYVPPQLDQYTVPMPGTQGGVNYFGGAFDPELGLYVANVNNLGQPMRIVRNPDGSYSNSGPLAGLTRFWDPEQPPALRPHALGRARGGERQHRRDRLALDARGQRHPAGGQAQHRAARPGRRHRHRRRPDLHRRHRRRPFRAFATKTGKQIWTVKLPASAEATPITYRGANGNSTWWSSRPAAA